MASLSTTHPRIGVLLLLTACSLGARPVEPSTRAPLASAGVDVPDIADPTSVAADEKAPEIPTEAVRAPRNDREIACFGPATVAHFLPLPRTATPRDDQIAAASRLDAKARRGLTRAANIMREFPQLRLESRGHADDQEGLDKATRRDLSRARAEAVRSFLTEHQHIDAARIDVIGLGDDEPIDARGAAANRRVELRCRFTP